MEADQASNALAQSVRSLSFETWCANHDAQHEARWCRELYPWAAFAQADYRDSAMAQPQTIEGYTLTVLDKSLWTKGAGRTEIRVRLETTGSSETATWRSGRWSDDFVLVAASDGPFITLFTEKRDPAKDALVDFMTGRLDRLEAKRCVPWSALLFRTLVAEIAAGIGTWERGVVFPVDPSLARAGHREHSQHHPDGRPIRPFLSNGRSVWVMYGFAEEKAHRQALYNEGQCRSLISVYCHPTLTSHHRSSSPSTKVVSLFEFARKSNRAAAFVQQIRFLTNHMRLADTDVPLSQPLHQATAALRAAVGPQEIRTSELREARAALGLEVCTVGDVAYAFAAANLLNAATNARAKLYRGAQKLPKETYTFKQRVGAWIASLCREPVNGVAVYVPPREQDAVYVRVDDVQFSFHAIPRVAAITDFAASSRNVEQTWSGVPLQLVAPAVLAWGRAAFLADGNVPPGGPA